MSIFAVSYVSYDHEGNEWLVLKGIYDCVDLCHDYIKSKRTNNNITLFHKREPNSKRDAHIEVYNHNFQEHPKYDYVIEEIKINQHY